MPDRNLPLLQSYQPTTFAERGVAVPFTTPLLSGARVRAAERIGTELIVPNPSGGRGVYILPWSSARQLCRPTVHDTRLYERLGQLPALTPAAVRQAARAVAAEGLAGREVSAAGAAAANTETNERLLANFLLLMALVEEVDPGSIPLSATLQPTVDLERRAKRAVAQVAPMLGRTPEHVAADLEALAVFFGPVGVPPQANEARLPRLIAAMKAFRDEADAWALTGSEDDLMAVARMLAAATARAISLGETALRDARAAAVPVTGLLRLWGRTREATASRINQADWLLDGWAHIVLLWRDARRPDKRRAALLETAQLVPLVPQQATGGQPQPEPGAEEDCCRVITLSDGWRTGPASFALVARNERLRAQDG